MSPVSAPKISKAEDRAMDRSASKAKPAPPGLSIRHGPVNGEPMDVDLPNGTAKRKARASISKTANYKDDSDSDSDDAVPLVRRRTGGTACCRIRPC